MMGERFWKPSSHEDVERSSLGTPAAKAARDSASDEQAARVVERARQIEADARFEIVAATLAAHRETGGWPVVCSCGWEPGAAYDGSGMHRAHVAAAVVTGLQR